MDTFPGFLGRKLPLHCIPQQLNRITTHRSGSSIRGAPSSVGLSLLSALSMDTQSRSSISLPSLEEPLLSIGPSSVRPLSLPGHGDPSPGATSHISEIVQGHDKKRENVTQGESYRHAVTIGTLSDNVLLEIFDFYRNNHDYTRRTVWKWHLLVHVCRRWRQVVFASPHRLNLQILCTYGTPVKKNLDIWPAFPIVIDYRHEKIVRFDKANILAALEHPDRVYFVRLYIWGQELEKVAAVMQEQLPVLTHIKLYSSSWRIGNAPVLPAEFLGGSAPSLQEITLSGIPYPALPTLLSSASDLVKLDLFNIPPTGYISPEEMVASLAALPRLEIFVIGFKLATSRPDRIHPPPVTRTVLPALNSFRFRGASEYLEDLVSRIDGPQLNQISIVYLNQVVDFQVPQFSEFIDRSVGPEVTLFGHAEFSFSNDSVAFSTYRHANHSPWDRRPARTIISCKGIDWQVSHVAQVLSQLSATLANVVHLKLKAEPEGCRLEGTDEVEWPLLLHQFPTVQTLHVSRELAGHVALALEDITGETVAEVLPSLDSIRIVGQPVSSIEKFVAARRLSGRPVAVIDTETEFDERLGSYVDE